MKAFFFQNTIALLIILTSFSAFSQWNPSNTGLPDSISVTNFLKVNSRILAATSKGVYVSDDNGYSWTQKNTGLHDIHITNFVLKGTDIYLVSGDSLCKSTDNGNSWFNINAMPASYGCELFIFSDLLFTTSGHEVYLSNDLGLHWIPKSNGLPLKSITTIFAIDSVLMVGFTEGGIWFSTDTANSWFQQNDTSMINNGSYIFDFASRNDVLLCAALSPYGSLFLSNNYGQSWTPVTYFTSTEVELVYWFGDDIFIIRDNYLTDSIATIYRSNDNGNNWYAYDQGMKIQSGCSAFIIANNDVLCGTQPIQPHSGQFQYDSVGIWRRPLSQSGGIEKDIADVSGLLVYPNPATEILYIENRANYKGISIYNIQGLLLLNVLLQQDENKIDITDMAKGVYIVKLYCNNFIVTKKIVKE